MLFLQKKSKGFTLIEMVMVIVLLGIIAGILTPFILKAMQAYLGSKARAELVGKGRLAMERLSREVRQAVPNSLSVVTDGSGNTGIEFARARAGGRYVEQSDNFGTEFWPPTNRFRKNASLTNLYTTYSENAIPAGSRLSFSPGDTLVIGNTSPAALQSFPADGFPAVALTGIDITDAVADGTANGQILRFPGGHRFTVESPGKHFHIVDQTIEVGLNGGLRWHTASGLNGYDGNGDWVPGDPMLVNGVTGVTFTYSPGTPQSTGVLRIDMQLTDTSGTESIRLYHEIHVRNTP